MPKDNIYFKKERKKLLQSYFAFFRQSLTGVFQKASHYVNKIQCYMQNTS